jgi:hypothetical protein
MEGMAGIILSSSPNHPLCEAAIQTAAVQSARGILMRM